MSKTIADLMAEKGRAALDDDKVYEQYKLLDSAQKSIADLMAEKGRAALDDDKVYEQYKSLPVDEGKTVEGGIVFLKPTTKEKADEYVRNQGKQLLENDLQNILTSNSQSDTPKDDRLTDPTNPMFRDLVKAGYQKVREGLAYPAGLITGLEEKGAQYIPVIGESTKKEQRKPLSDYISENIQAGKDNKGLTGIIADPMTLTMFVPGLGEVAMGSDIAKAAVKGSGIIGRNPTISEAIIRGGAGAIEGAGYGGISGGEKGAEYGSVIGGGLGLGSGLMKGLGKSWFPGLTDQNNRKITEMTRDNVKDNLDMFLSQGILPQTKNGMLDIVDRNKERIGQKYSEGIKTLDNPKINGETVDLERLKTELSEIDPTTKLEELYNNSGLQPKISDYNLPFARTLEGIKPKMVDKFEDRLASRDALEKPFQRMLKSDLESALQSKIKRSPDNSLYSAKELSELRTNKTNPETYKNPDSKIAMARKDLGRTWRDVINGELESDPRYAQFVTPELKKEYGTYSNIEDLINSPGRTGLADRLPFGLAIGPWLKSSTTYKVGQGLGLAGRLRLGERFGEK